LALPSWTESLSKDAQDKLQVRAKKSLRSALDKEREFERNLKMVTRVFPGGEVI
jgi:hypothetical protein